MLKIISLLIVVCFAGTSMAQTTYQERLKNGTNNLRLLLGSSQGTSDVGLDYERRMDFVGLGVFLFFSEKRDATSTLPAKLEQSVLGITTPVHLIDQSNFDIYIAPGLTAFMSKDVPPDLKDVTSFGPVLKIGAMYHFPHYANWSLGLDFMTITNWFEKKVEASQSYANLGIGYIF